jgi:hypothetical protein
MEALGQQAVHPLDGVKVGIRAELKYFVVVDEVLY